MLPLALMNDEYLRKRGMLVETGRDPYEIECAMLRTHQDCICPVCGKKYREHPYIHEVRDWEGSPFLHLICNGMVVKL